MSQNLLFYGDNLDILRNRIPTESVDLVYLDPPFNSNRSYNVLFGTHRTGADQAQIEAFDDTWTWTPDTDRIFMELINGGVPPQVAEALQAFNQLMGEGDVLAYLVMMAPRLVELRRVLKSTGSAYLHCDPTASHYLKILMDSIFDPQNFRNEIIWKRTSAHSSAKRYGPVHDVLLFYSKGEAFTWNPSYTPHDPEGQYVRSHYTQVDPEGRRFTLSDLTAAGVRHGSSGRPWRDFDPTSKGNHWKFTIENFGTPRR